LTGGGTTPMTEGIRKTEDKRKDKLQNQIDELKSPSLADAADTSKTAEVDAAQKVASDAASEQIKKKRRSAILSGGKTDLTGNEALLAAGQTKSATLLGA
jgi:hypothetical protein